MNSKSVIYKAFTTSLLVALIATCSMVTLAVDGKASGATRAVSHRWLHLALSARGRNADSRPDVSLLSRAPGMALALVGQLVFFEGQVS